jgi:hypothetical protein
MNKCTFSGNKTGNGGGGFDGNGKSGGAGGAIYSSALSANFFNCVITGNSTGTGGDISADGQYSYRAGNGGSGAGIYCTTALLANCLIYDNITGRGGNAALWQDNPVLYSGNGGNGGGIYSLSSSIINSTIASNFTGEKGTVTQGGTDGIKGMGAIYCDPNTILANSIVWNPSISQLAGQDNTKIKYCDIMDSNFAGVNGNISADPLFSSSDTNDFHLLTNSPCIDAGDNTSVPAQITTDIEGFDRFFDAPLKTDTGNGSAPIVDIGVYECSKEIFNQTRSTYHNTIQEAVNSALPNDKIYIYPSVYSGPGNRDIDLLGKSIELHGVGEDVIIDCMGTKANPHRAFKLTAGSYICTIDGFTIINGFAPLELCLDSIYRSVGGAIFTSGNSPVIKNCKFTNNDSNNWGGAIYFANSIGTISNCLFVDNYTSEIGGAIYFNSSTPNVKNCTFYNNTAGLSGGAIRLSNCQDQIISCIVWENFAQADAQITGCTPGEIGPYPVRDSDVQQGFSGYGNINADPYFADPLENDLHLKSQFGRWDENQEQWIYDDITSPCIDTGNMYESVREELWPNGKRLNMGFYGGTTQASMSPSIEGNIADLNNDDYVNKIDLLIFVDSWLKNENLLPADTNRNGRVDFEDFVTFADNWLWQNPLPHE